MILKLAVVATASALSAACGSSDGIPRADFEWGLANSRVEFDLSVPASDWALFTLGERVDVRGNHLGPHTRDAVFRSIEYGVTRSRICRDGWSLKDMTVDWQGAHHFWGTCASQTI